MKRRDFFGASLLAGGALLHNGVAVAETKIDWPCVHNSNDAETTIFLPGLTEPVSVLQIADSHLSCDAEADAEFLSYSKRMGGGTVTTKRFEYFDTLLKKARDEKFDLIALTGDILNYPSATGVRAVLERLENNDVPFLYTAGNHDWHYEGMDGSSEELRKVWIEKRLKPLYQDKDPAASSTVLKGVNFICIDNSTYEISPGQLEFYRRQAARPEPIVLLTHIPLYMPSLDHFSCGSPDWCEAKDPYYKIERRPPWPKDGCSETTRNFVREVWGTPRLAGVFVGHTHRASTIIAGKNVQYVAAAALSGATRTIRIRPLDAGVPVQ